MSKRVGRKQFERLIGDENGMPIGGVNKRGLDEQMLEQDARPAVLFYTENPNATLALDMIQPFVGSWRVDGGSNRYERDEDDAISTAQWCLFTEFYSHSSSRDDSDAQKLWGLVYDTI